MDHQGTYWVTDGEGDTLRLEGTPQECAQEYVDRGNWGDSNATDWIDIHVYNMQPWTDGFDADENHVDTITIAITPEEPDCDHEDGHIWGTPYSLLGGCEGNPGVYASGGGTKGTDVCMLCGLAKHWDTWAQRRDTGEQGLYGIRYETSLYGADIVDCDENHAIVEINDSCFLVSFKRETYINTYDGMSATVNGQRYIVKNGRWEEVSNDEES